MITRPRDREVVCHASAWDVDNDQDIRVKMCTRVNADDFYTVHHELGHNFYQRAYAGQPYLFRGGANDGFHEAIGDFVGLSALTPTYLKQVGIIDTVPGADADIPYLLNMAMDKIAFLPFGLLVDKWRWQVFSGQVDPCPLQRGLVEAAHPVPGRRPARTASGRRLRSRRQVPRRRQHALHPLLPGPGLSVPVLPGRLPPGRLEGAAEPLLGLWRQGGRREVRENAGHGPVQALARGPGGLHRRSRGTMTAASCCCAASSNIPADICGATTDGCSPG
jgi:hypothetical protein